MRRYLMPMAAALMAGTALPNTASAQDAVTTVDLNMRAGPSTAFPVVDVIPDSAPVDVHGCVDGYSWCDVTAAGSRGWVSASYLSYMRGDNYLPLVEYVEEYDVPIVTFSVGSYWDNYYRARPWYAERARWRERWRDNWRDIRRDYRAERRQDRREDRAERREERRDDRADRRGDRREQRVERRQDRRAAVQERRENRRERVQDRRRENRVERREQRRDVREQRRESRMERRDRNRGARSESRSRQSFQQRSRGERPSVGRSQGRAERGGGRRGREG
jgi:uncharacterized protein YraI